MSIYNVLQDIKENTDSLGDGSLDANITQLNGATIAVNSGVLSGGVQRVCIATDDINIKKLGDSSFNDTASSTQLIRASVRLYDGVGSEYVPAHSGAGNTSNQTQRVCIADNDTNLLKLSNCVDTVNTRLEIDLNGINGTATAVSSGVLTNGCQRMSIATDDLNMVALRKMIDPRLINAGRKVYGGGTTVAANGTYTIMSAANFALTGASPYRDSSQIYVETVNAGDNGKILRYSWFNNANPSVFTSNSSVAVSSAGNTNLAANIHEITDMYIEDAGGNAADIYVKDANANLVAEIRNAYRFYTPFGIQVPKNGCVLLTKLEVDNVETAAVRSLEFSVQLMRNTAANSKTYAIIFRGILPNLKSISYDLTGIAKIKGSDYSAVFPAARGIGGTVTCGMYLHGIVYDESMVPTPFSINSTSYDHYIKPWA